MKRSILVVDDEEAIRIILKAALEFTVGWGVRLVSSGEEGLSALKTDKPDAILLDVMMPGMDGISFFYRLQEQPSTQEIPVIFLTAQAREPERRKLSALGSGVILKPFEPETIASQIKSMLNWTD